MSQSPSSPSRREILAVAAVTVSLPMLQTALGGLRAIRAAGPQDNAPAPAEQPGWFATTLKPADLKEDTFTAVEGHVGVLLSRSGKNVIALSSKCTHKGCTLRPKSGQKTLTCGCHRAQFNLDGTVAKPPAKDPLPHFAIRVNDKGVLEIDPGQKVAADASNASVTVS